jgi:hypothetical protein
MLNQIYSVKKFNILQTTKWQKDCNNWKGKGSLPFIGMYIYEQKSGFILKYSTGSKWFKTKKLAQEAQHKFN